MYCLCVLSFAATLPSMKSSNSSSSRSNDTCMPMTMMALMPQGNGTMHMCMCCEKSCNSDPECFVQPKAVSRSGHVSLPPALAGMMPQHDPANMTLHDKCNALRMSTVFIHEVCDAVDAMPSSSAPFGRTIGANIFQVFGTNYFNGTEDLERQYGFNLSEILNNINLSR